MLLQFLRWFQFFLLNECSTSVILSRTVNNIRAAAACCPQASSEINFNKSSRKSLTVSKLGHFTLFCVCSRFLFLCKTTYLLLLHYRVVFYVTEQHRLPYCFDSGLVSFLLYFYILPQYRNTLPNYMSII